MDGFVYKMYEQYNVAKHQKAMVEIWKQIACEMGEKIGIDLWGFKFNE